MRSRTIISLFTFALLTLSAPSASSQYSWRPDANNPLLGDQGRLLEPSILYDAAKAQYDLWYSDGYFVKRGVSTDGRTWTLTGSYQSMIDLFSAEFCFSVEIVKIGSVYHMYSGLANAGTYYIGLATSVDGNSWVIHPSSPVITPGGASTWEKSYVMYPKIVLRDGVYFMYYQGNGSQDEVGLATSSDGVHWEKFGGNPVIRIQQAGENATAISPSGVEVVNGMLYMLLNSADNNTLQEQTNLMTSSDGTSWSFYEGNPVMTTGAQGTWNYGWLGNGTLRYLQGKFWYWYSATDTRPYQGTQVFRMGLATSGGNDPAVFWHQTSGPGVHQDIRSFASNSHGDLFAGTWTAGEVYKTTDNGDTWTVCGAIPNANPVMGLAVDHHDHIWASVFLRGMALSTDNGASWEWKNSGLTNNAVRNALVDRQGNVWVASEGGAFCWTKDGGSWTNKKPARIGYIVMDSTGAILAREDDPAGNSTLHRSTDGGASWASQNMPNLGIAAVHPDGSYWAQSFIGSHIFRASEWGAEWIDMQSPVSWTGNTAWMMITRRGHIYYSMDGYNTGVLRSTNNGATWHVVNEGLTTTHIYVMYPHPNGYLFLGTTTSGVFRSTQPDVPQPVTVSLPSVVTAAGSTMEIPIEVSDVGGHGILAYEFTVAFNSPDSILSVDAMPVTAGTLSGQNGWSVMINTAVANHVQVAAYGATPLAGRGALLKLKVSTSTLAVAGDSTALTFTKFLFNSGDPVPTLHQGGLMVRDRVCGDADENGSIQAYDAALTLREAVGPMSPAPPPLTTMGRLNADVSKNGKVEAYDAALILRHVVGLAMPESTLTCFESGSGAPSEPRSLVLGARVLGVVRGAERTSVRVQFTNVPTAMAVYSCAFELMASAMGGDSTTLELPSLPEGSLGTVHRLGNGRFRVGIVNPHGLDVAALPITLSARYAASVDRITFMELYLNDASGGQISLVNVTTSVPGRELESGRPASYDLIGAYPNPFNPSTRIIFENPVTAPVRLEIYNAQGALVKMLSDEPVGPGRHEITWDGANSYGQIVATGEYFCVMRTGSFVKSVRLLLIK